MCDSKYKPNSVFVATFKKFMPQNNIVITKGIQIQLDSMEFLHN